MDAEVKDGEMEVGGMKNDRVKDRAMGVTGAEDEGRGMDLQGHAMVPSSLGSFGHKGGWHIPQLCHFPILLLNQCLPHTQLFSSTFGNHEHQGQRQDLKSVCVCVCVCVCLWWRGVERGGEGWVGGRGDGNVLLLN